MRDGTGQKDLRIPPGLPKQPNGCNNYACNFVRLHGRPAVDIWARAWKCVSTCNLQQTHTSRRAPTYMQTYTGCVHVAARLESVSLLGRAPKKCALACNYKLTHTFQGRAHMYTAGIPCAFKRANQITEFMRKRNKTSQSDHPSRASHKFL